MEQRQSDPLPCPITLLCRIRLWNKHGRTILELEVDPIVWQVKGQRLDCPGIPCLDMSNEEALRSAAVS